MRDVLISVTKGEMEEMKVHSYIYYAKHGVGTQQVWLARIIVN